MLSALVVLGWCTPSHAGDDLLQSVKIDATLSIKGDRIFGTASWTIINDTGKPLSSIPFWLYPNRFAESGVGLKDHEISWIYPSGNSKGGIALEHLAVGGRKVEEKQIRYESMPAGGTPASAARMIVHVPLDQALPPGERITIDIRFETTIPKRRGRFGRTRDAVMLAEGWYPRALTDLTGDDPSLPPDTIRADVAVHIPEKRGAVLVDTVLSPEDPSQTIRHVADAVVNIPFVAMRGLNVRRMIQNGTDIAFISARYAEKNKFNVGDRIFKVAGEVAAALHKLAPGAVLPEKLTIAEIPAWDQLVGRSGNILLVSDQIYQLVQTEQVRAFHDEVLSANLAAALIRPLTVSSERLEMREIMADLVGDVAERIWLEERKVEAADLHGVVGFLSFLPYVDNLLYAPQIPFQNAYDSTIEPQDPTRDDFWRFMNRLPRGRRIAAKYSDILGEDEVRRRIRDSLSTTTSCADALEAALGKDAARFRKQWFGAYPEVAVRIADLKEIALKDGEYLHQVTVERIGADIAEPVTIRIVDKDDRSADLLWQGDSRTGTVSWQSKAKRKSVQIDPFRRLVDAENLTEGHPLADNEDPLPMRPPLLTRFLIWFDSVTLDPTIDIAFALARKYDINDSFHLSATYSPRLIGGEFAWYRHFGPKNTLNARTAFAGPEFSVYYYRRTEDETGTIPQYALEPATLGNIGVAVGRNDRQYGFDPRNGRAMYAWMGYGLGSFDNGTPVYYGKGLFRAIRVVSPAIGHNFAWYGGLDGVAGEVPASNLVTLSTRMALRGFDLNETYGRAGVYTVMEYRHTLLGSTPITMPLFTRLDRVQGVLFAGTGTVTDPDGYEGMFSEERIFVEAGYGLRFFFLLFGALPYMLAIDVAVPILPLDRSYETTQNGETVTVQRAPVRFVFGVSQTY